MPNLAEKQQTVEDLKQALQGTTITVVADYRGLSVAEITELRRALRKENATLTVAKNTLSRRAVDGTDKEALKAILSGPTALLIGKGDQVAPVKALTAFLKKAKKTNELRGGLLEGQLLSPQQVAELADMPSMDELRGKLVGAIASPMNSLVSALSSPQRALANVLDQFAKQKEGASA